MSRLNELCPELCVVTASPDRWRWYVRSEADALALIDIGSTTAADPRPGCHVASAQHKPGRREFLVVERGARTWFTKRFLLRDSGEVIRETLRLDGHVLGFKGAVTEAANTLLAERRLSRVVRLHGLGERLHGGLVTRQVLLFDALTDHEDLGQALQRAGDAPRQRALLARSFAVALEFLRAGLVHLDLNSKNVMLSRSTPGDDYAIDLEQVVEVEPGREDVLAFCFGYLYLIDSRRFVSLDDYDQVAFEWISRALDGAPIPASLERSYRYFQKNSIGRRTRLRLSRVGLERMSRMHRRVRLQPVQG